MSEFIDVIRSQIKTFIIAAFASVTALCWNDSIRDYFTKILQPDDITDRFIFAAIVTVIAAVSIGVITYYT